MQQSVQSLANTQPRAVTKSLAKQRHRFSFGVMSAVAGTALAALLGTMAITAPAESAEKQPVPVLLELFTSEGCSSCPPADRLLTELLELQPFDKVELIGVGQHVDYWDRLGWKDPYGSAAFSNRQRQYARNRGDRKVYTPQLVVNGQSHVVGSQPEKVFDAIERVRSANIKTLQLSASLVGNEATISFAGSSLSSLKQSKVKLTFAVVQDGISTDVQAGENRGRQLQHSAVARSLQSENVKPSSRIQQRLPLPTDTAKKSLRIVVFAQDINSDAVLAVGQINLAG